jgi:hypothetical protein
VIRIWELAMNMKRSTERPTPRTVLVRLARGVSSHGTWLLRSSVSAATTTIGSDASCDWQIHARGVPGHALSVALFDGGLFIASGPGAEVWLEGELLPEVWQRVDSAQSIEVGEARLEMAWQEEASVRELSSERDRPTFPDDLAGQHAAPTQTARTSWVEHVARASWLDTPSLLGRTAQSRSSGHPLRYAALILFTALAYQAWLILLDRI